MYRKFYGFNLEPFHITPDPRFFFLSPSHREALAAIAYGVKNRKGFIAVTAEVGLGKTTVVRTFLEKYGGNYVKTILVFNADITFANLIQLIFAELGLKPKSNEVFQQIQQLHQHLIDLYKLGLTVVLIIDEAQNMPVKTLENMRMLSNLETTREKLLQIILVGQPELDVLLERTELRQLKQRLAVRAKLLPLTSKESALYVQYRLKKAGGSLKTTFTKGALKRVISYADGIPRKINIVCDNALISGYGAERRPVGEGLVREAIADLEGRKWRRYLPWIAVILLAVVLAGGALSYWRLGQPGWPEIKQRLSSLAPIFLENNEHTAHNNEKPAEPAKTRVVVEPESGSQPAEVKVESSLSVKADNALPGKVPAGAALSGGEKAEKKEKSEVMQFPSAASAESPKWVPPSVFSLPAVEEPGKSGKDEASPPGEGKSATTSAASLEAAKRLVEPDWPAGLRRQVTALIPCFPRLTPVRQRVLLEMADSLGTEGLKSFVRMQAALERGDYDEAARQILYSEWARRKQFQVFRLAIMMKKG